jgi:hypothetical protein
MKKIIIFGVLFFISNSVLFSQSTFSLNKLIELANIKSIETFDKEITKLGYSIKDTTYTKDKVTYAYRKKVITDDGSYECHLDYLSYKKSSPTISFITYDLAQINIVKKDLRVNGFNLIQDKSNTTQTLLIYGNGDFFLGLKEKLNGERKIQRIDLYAR